MKDQRRGMSRKATLIVTLSMFGVAIVTDLLLLFGHVPSHSIQNRVGSLAANTLLGFGLFVLSLRYLEDKKKRTEGIFIAVLVAIAFIVLMDTYLSSW